MNSIIQNVLYTKIFTISPCSNCTDVQGSMEHSLKNPPAKSNIYTQLVDEYVIRYELKKLTLIQIDCISCFLLISEPDASAWTDS